MNTRIKELAEQASLYAASDNSSMSFDVWKKRYTEKFAELIIKECVDVTFDYDVEEAGEVIKEHFGVKE